MTAAGILLWNDERTHLPSENISGFTRCRVGNTTRLQFQRTVRRSSPLVARIEYLYVRFIGFI